jgi:hypothetical protein
LVSHWRGRLDEALEAAAVPTAEQLDAPPVLDRLALHHAGAVCPAGAMVPDPERFDAEGRFVEAAFTCTREVALTALRRTPPGRPAMEIVQEAIAEPEALRWGVGDWLSQTDRAGHSTLRNASVSWVTDVRALAARHGEPQWQSPAALAYQPKHRGVALAAAVDAVRVTGVGTHLFLMRARRHPTDRRVAGRVALLWILVRGEEPTSVVLGMRDSLERDVTEVDEELLEEATAHAVNDLRWGQRPSLAPLVPGAHCRYCRLLPRCAEGTEQVALTCRYPFPPTASAPC